MLANDDDPATDPVPLDEARDRSLTGDIQDLASHARSFAEAEISFQKTRAAYAGREMGGVIALAVLAAVFALLLMISLALGTLLVLATVFTPLGALAIVVGTLLVLTLACVLGALFRWSRLVRTVKGEKS